MLGLTVHYNKTSQGGRTAGLLSVTRTKNVWAEQTSPMTLTGYVSKIRLKVTPDCSLRCVTPAAWKTCPEKYVRTRQLH